MGRKYFFYRFTEITRKFKCTNSFIRFSDRLQKYFSRRNLIFFYRICCIYGWRIFLEKLKVERKEEKNLRDLYNWKIILGILNLLKLTGIHFFSRFQMQFGITVDRNFYGASSDRLDDDSPSIRYFRRVEIFSSNITNNNEWIFIKLF